MQKVQPNQQNIREAQEREKLWAFPSSQLSFELIRENYRALWEYIGEYNSTKGVNNASQKSELTYNLGVN